MDSTRHQEILDRCWNALPEGCPMRQWDREQFDDVWGYWQSSALARVDPTCAIPESPLFVEIFAEEPDEEVRKAHKVLIAEHYLWLLCSGAEHAFAAWNKATMFCRNKAENPDKQHRQLIKFIEIAHEHPTYKLIKGEVREYWTQDTVTEIKNWCVKNEPELFSNLYYFESSASDEGQKKIKHDHNLWRRIENNAVQHLEGLRRE
jgi:hypothetical protein